MRKIKIQPTKFFILFLLLIGFLGAAGYLTITLFPGAGAQGANLLRSILGNQMVAFFETVVFQVQDQVEALRYRSGMSSMNTPWEISTSPNNEVEPPAPPVVIQPTETQKPTNITVEPYNQPKVESTPIPTLIPTVTVSPTPSKWVVPSLKPMGSMQGEGIWTEYISSSGGHTVAYRTFLQPDPERPYAVVGIVAFDLKRTNLRFVLGTDEPFGGGARRPGKIPDTDLRPNRLLATFNGGFQATHGEYGAMSDGITALPPKPGIGTIVIRKNGQVEIGAWGKHFNATEDMISFRQNCPLVIEDGAINPVVNQNRVQDWGGTVDGHIVTWRSAVGINQDKTILYYIAGSKLNMPIMAKTLLNIGAHQAVQLDINESWVHFVAVRSKDTKLAVEPLFTQGMTFRPDRYLTAYSRDFFYVTSVD